MEEKMSKIDVRSALVGVLITVVMVFGVAAVADMHSGRYNISMCATTTPGTFFICVGDTATGKYSVERCVEQIPATSAMMTHIGIFPNPFTEKHTE
jgi:hypothetical protein